jgi:CheY-like chemotaxis protein
MSSDRKTSRVLVADDDQSIRRLLGTIVKRERIDVDCVADGMEAIEYLKAREYSVILLDLMMPRANGFDVIDYLKQNPPAQKPLVLVITAYADQRFKEVDPAIVAGVIRKPFEVAEVGSLVRHCVEGYQNQLSKQLATADDSTMRQMSQRRVDIDDFATLPPEGNDHGVN